MRFRQYIEALGSELSEVKVLVLTRLWQEGTAFPRGWVKSSELLWLTKQKYFDRRVRELRDELGCDIETGSVTGEHSYRLVSLSISVANPRAYLTASQKQHLFEDAQHTCAVCGGRFAAGVRGLQADHRVPLKRGGAHDSANWQPLCVECNVGKRRACAGCNLDCQTCPWAFPERTGRRVLLQISIDLEQKLREESERRGKSMDEIVAEALRAKLDGER